VDPVYNSYIDSFNLEIDKVRESAFADIDSLIEEPKPPHLPDNFDWGHVRSFIETKDFYSTYQTLLSRRIKYFTQFSWLPQLYYTTAESSTGSIEEYKKLAEKYSVRYVINPKEIQLVQSYGKPVSDIYVEMYDNSIEEIVISNYHTGDSDNPGGMYTCKDEIFCSVSNSVLSSLDSIIYYLMENQPTLKNKKQTIENRVDQLHKYGNKHYKEEDKHNYFSDIVFKSIGIPQQSVFYTLANSDSSKFISFYTLPIADVNAHLTAEQLISYARYNPNRYDNPIGYQILYVFGEIQKDEILINYKSNTSFLISDLTTIYEKAYEGFANDEQFEAGEYKIDNEFWELNFNR
jgi:hypothetical protein